MKRLIVFGLVSLAGASAVSAQVHVKGYTTKNGTYVAPYERTKPDSTILNNYSTSPNVNPYTGKVGTVNPYSPSTAYKNPYAPPPKPSTPCYFNCPN